MTRPGTAGWAAAALAALALMGLTLFGPACAPAQATPAAAAGVSPTPDLRWATQVHGLGSAKPKKCAPNLLKCAKQGADNIGRFLDNPAAPVANAVLKPIADGVAGLTNQMIRVILTEWLYQPSIRLTKSGVFLRNDPHRPKGGPRVGCLGPQQPGPQPGPQPTPAPQPTPQPSGKPPTASPPTGVVPLAADPKDHDKGTGTGGPQGSCDDKNLPDAQGTSKISTVRVQSVMLGVGMIIAVLLLIFQGIRTALTRKGTPLLEAFRGLLIMAVHTAVAITVLDSLLVASDALTKTIIDSSLGDGLGLRMFAVLGLSTAALGPVPVIFFGIVIFIIGLLQLITLFFRQAAIPVLAMLFPVAAAGQVGGNASRQWLVRLWTAVFAIVVYKPLAALIFAVGFLEIGEGRGFWDFVRGLVTLTLTIFALPMLMKVFDPIVGQAVGDGYQSGFGKFASAAGDAVNTAASLATLPGGGSAGAGASGGESGDGSAPADPASYEQYTADDDQDHDDDASGVTPGQSTGSSTDAHQTQEQPQAGQQDGRPGDDDTPAPPTPAGLPGEASPADGSAGADQSTGTSTSSGSGAAAVTGDPTTTAVTATAGEVENTVDSAGQATGEQADHAARSFAGDGGVQPPDSLPEQHPAEQPTDQFQHSAGPSGPDTRPVEEGTR